MHETFVEVEQSLRQALDFEEKGDRCHECTRIVSCLSQVFYMTKQEEEALNHSKLVTSANTIPKTAMNISPIKYC